MSMKTIRVVGLATMVSVMGALSFAGTSFAQTSTQQATPQVPMQNTQPAPRISVSQMAAKLEQAGYTIREIDSKYYGWEVEVIDNNRQLLELHVDTQGNITRQKYD